MGIIQNYILTVDSFESLKVIKIENRSVDCTTIVSKCIIEQKISIPQYY